MKYIWSITFLLSLCSCSRDDSTTLEIGQGFTNIDTRVLSIDTMTVLTSTFKFDSLGLSSSNRLLIGNYDDTVFGKADIESYLQFIRTFDDSGTSTNSFDIENEASYDSIALILKYDRYFYNDTIPAQRYRIHQLTEDIEYDDDATQFYNTTRFNHHATPIADVNVLVRPQKEDSLFIKLDHNFGNALFENIKNGTIETNDEFLDQYKGLLIKSYQSNTAVIGLNKNSALRIYYSLPDETDPIEKIFNFSLNTTNSFTHTTNTYENTPFEQLTDQELQLPSSDSEDFSYIQSGVGLTTKIDIPYIHELHNIPGNGVLVEAILKLPVKTFDTDLNLAIRDSISAFLVNDKLENIGTLIGATDGIYATLSDQSSEFDNIYYSIDIKSFLDLKLEENNFQETYFIALNPKEFESSIDRYLLYNAEENDKKIILELLYAIYDED